MGTKTDEKVAALRARVEELKSQLAVVKAEREQVRASRSEAYQLLDTIQHERNVLQQERNILLQERGHLSSEVNRLHEQYSPELREDLDRFLTWCQIYGRPVYYHDALATWIRNTDAFTSSEFMQAYQRGMHSGHKIGRTKGSAADTHIEWRIHMALWAASHAAGLEGDFVECGVNTGTVSLAICTYLDFNTLNRDFYLFDTYCGIPEEQMSSAEKDKRIEENALLYEECYETAVQNFAPWPRCHLVRGKVPDTLTSAAISKVAYLHLDMNIAEPERAALEFFWDKMVPGGVILLDDYGFSTYRAQYDSANAFAKSRGVMIATLPTGQGVMIKR